MQDVVNGHVKCTSRYAYSFCKDTSEKVCKILHNTLTKFRTIRLQDVLTTRSALTIPLPLAFWVMFAKDKLHATLNTNPSLLFQKMVSDRTLVIDHFGLTSSLVYPVN